MDEQIKALTQGLSDMLKAAQNPAAANPARMQTSKKLQYIDRVIFGVVIIAAVIACFININIADKIIDLAKFVAGVVGLGTVGYMYNSAVEKKANIEADATKYEAKLSSQNTEPGDI